MTRVGKKPMFNGHRQPDITGNFWTLLFLFVSAALSAQASPTPSPHVSSHSSQSSPDQFNKRRTLNVRVAAASCAAVSMAASFIAFYWFCRMEKRFRHKLIMLLIYGDAMKATWLFVFAIVSIARGTVPTRSSFCQASGFLVQYGTETSDYSVLVMAIHSAIQVFRPSTMSRNNGLYPFRAYIYAGAFLVPLLMSGLAFINPHWGYMSLGAFCSLPLRPFWYRLALAWIPRYMIATVILALAVAIYTHVGFEFQAFTGLERGKPSISTTTTIPPLAAIEESIRGSHQRSEAPQDRRPSSIVHEIVAARRPSSVASLVDTVTSLPNLIPHSGRSQSLSANPRRRSPSPISGSRISEVHSPAIQTGRSVVKSNECLASQPENDASNTHSDSASPLHSIPASHTQRQRLRTHRQVRLMFIYPLVYMLMWLIPFVNHCMMYQDKWAAHPLYCLTLANTICVTSMGMVDCLIFTLRERPWRHIPASDNTFLGSFMVWRRGSGSMHGGSRRRSVDDPQRSNTESGSLAGSVIRARAESFFGGTGLQGLARLNRGSDSQKAEAEIAMLRLKLEKKERRRENAENEVRRSEQNDQRLETIESPGIEIEDFGSLAGGSADAKGKGKEKEIAG